ncbi:MAG: ATP-binding protein [Promethearchaeota archaeon]
MDLDDLIEGSVNAIALVFFIIGICITFLIYRRKKTATNLIKIILFIVGFLYSLGKVFENFTTWYQAEEFGDIFAISLSIIILVVGVTAFYEHKLRESEHKLFLLNKDLEQQVERRTRELKTSEENYRTLVNNILDVIFELNSDKRISYMSPQISNLCGYKSEEMIDNKISEFIHNEDVSTVKRTINNTLKTGDNSFIECRMRNKSGNYVQVSIRGSLVKRDKDLKIIGVIRDITDQKRAETIIKEEVKKLKEIDQIRRDFVRRTSHELKTPLISIYSSSQYLLDSYKEVTESDILRIIKVINRGGNRLKKLTENLLAVYDIESKRLELQTQKENLTDLVKECTNDMELFLKERDLFLKLDINNSFIINVDRIKIEQVILNLLSNAIKNTPPKGIIYVGLKKIDDYVEIIIKDTGIGFTEAEKEIAFKKFGKIERKVKGVDIITEGSGLGLYISKEIVKLHKGKIWLESEGRNKGSIFTIRLPLNEH